MSEPRYTGSQLALAFVAGAAAGAVLGLLTAPRSGAETRAQLKTAALRGKDRAASLPQAFGAARQAFVERIGTPESAEQA